MPASGLSTASKHDTSGLLTWVVTVYLVAAYWVTQRLLVDWVDSFDLNLFVIQPAIWLGLAAIAYAGWRDLGISNPQGRYWVITAALVGAVYVGVLVFGGLVGDMARVRTQFNWLVYVENTWYVGSLLLGVETARVYLFHAWNLRRPGLAWPVTVLLFFVIATPYAQFEALDSVERSIEIIAGSFVPALGISILATWFAERGGMGASFAFRAPIQAFLWYSFVLPDLHWSTTMATGVAAAVIAFILAEPLAAALTEPDAAT